MGASTPHFALQLRNRVAQADRRAGRGRPGAARGRARDRTARADRLHGRDPRGRSRRAAAAAAEPQRPRGLELHARGAQAQLVAGADPGLDDPAPVDPGAVARAEVDDAPGPVAHDERGVATGDRRVAEDELAGRRAPQRDAAGLERAGVGEEAGGRRPEGVEGAAEGLAPAAPELADRRSGHAARPRCGRAERDRCGR